MRNFHLYNYIDGSSFCRTMGYGGVSILVNSGVNIEELPEVKLFSVVRNIEIAAIPIKNKNAIIVIVYGAPSGNFEVFLERVEDALTWLAGRRRFEHIYLIGDFNVDFFENTQTARR
ncbi:hypothetical protein HHI36_005206 [Cryptolaemus montrouzieri]|uniref:Uncharacterized protein n=1 Tax=Cryptolaemus montrouzieri TaxID=559131 RepID=A0ABD2NTG0_9CUCU